jgi:hypothetical protein
MAAPALQKVSLAAPSRFGKVEVIVISFICLLLPAFRGTYLSPRPVWMVRSPLILSTKTNQAAMPKTIDNAAQTLNQPAADIQNNSQGTLYSNPDISDASLTDMLQGDEIGDTAYVDLSKLQMFYFSIMAIVIYSCALLSGMGNIYPQEGFLMPVPSGTLVALLGISTRRSCRPRQPRTAEH